MTWNALFDRVEVWLMRVRMKRLTAAMDGFNVAANSVARAIDSFGKSYGQTRKLKQHDDKV